MLGNKLYEWSSGIATHITDITVYNNYVYIIKKLKPYKNENNNDWIKINFSLALFSRIYLLAIPNH